MTAFWLLGSFYFIAGLITAAILGFPFDIFFGGVGAVFGIMLLSGWAFVCAWLVIGTMFIAVFFFRFFTKEGRSVGRYIRESKRNGTYYSDVLKSTVVPPQEPEKKTSYVVKDDNYLLGSYTTDSRLSAWLAQESGKKVVKKGSVEHFFLPFDDINK